MNDEPQALTQEQFLEWRSPRRGTANPQEMSNSVWTWMIRDRINAYEVNRQFDGPSAFEHGPGWCFARFGQSETQLPDGRIVYIAGEHEDHYDPDFYIYNDVVVVSPSGDVVIYGYPVDAFPPTDFHSATLLGNALVLIGNLGYPNDRQENHTQVMQLDLTTWKITAISTTGSAPGWIHKHTACLSPNGREIVINGGEIDRRNDRDLVENIDEWSLDTETWHWKRLTQRSWPRFEIFREDRSANHIWEMQQYQWKKQVARHNLDKTENQLITELGALPDLEILSSLFHPAFATEYLGEDENDYGVYRIRIGDVVVRYVNDRFYIRVTIEGDLAEATLTQLQRDLVEKLTALERVPFHCRAIAPQ